MYPIPEIKDVQGSHRIIGVGATTTSSKWRKENKFDSERGESLDPPLRRRPLSQSLWSGSCERGRTPKSDFMLRMEKCCDLA